MTSKTKLERLVKALRADDVRAALGEKPELLKHVDKRGRNWLHLCASQAISGELQSRGEDSVRLAAALLELGIGINAPAFTEGSWQATPLWFALARGRNLPLARFLLQSGATPEHCLWAAAYWDDLDMLELLVTAGAPLEAVAEEETPLLHAVKFSKFVAAEFLLGAGSNPDYRDVAGMTALHYMLKKNSDARHFEMFANCCARVDIANGDGVTAAEIMRRKRNPFFHQLADRLAR